MAPSSSAAAGGSTCFKLTKLLLGGFLSKPPSKPSSLTVTPTTHSIELSWKPGPATSRYNTDAYVVEMAPRSERLKSVLGPAFSRYVQFYSGAECGYTIAKLQPEQSFAIRVRCVNSAGASAWIEVDVSTCQVPTNCGGTGPLSGGGGGRSGGDGDGGTGDAGTGDGDGDRMQRYTWDQTPTHVEVCIPAPATLTPKQVKVKVKPRHIEVLMDGKAVFAGKLPKEVLCQEDGDFEWELRDATSSSKAAAGAGAGASKVAGAGAGAGPAGGGGGKKERELFITLEKRIFDCVQYDPQEQWDRALDEDGHPKIDRAQLKWFRDYEWRPPQDARNVDEVKKALPVRVRPPIHSLVYPLSTSNHVRVSALDVQSRSCIRSRRPITFALSALDVQSRSRIRSRRPITFARYPLSTSNHVRALSALDVQSCSRAIRSRRPITFARYPLSTSNHVRALSALDLTCA